MRCCRRQKGVDCTGLSRMNARTGHIITQQEPRPPYRSADADNALRPGAARCSTGFASSVRRTLQILSRRPGPQ
uniref:Uncharacterized protein n=1 Tax=Tanacetum cinerariifolium TaxID=118510 RepID=A0A699VG51_TANCI|nr:hypothetical protein [Tanacetum cinerariifolium]